MKRLALVFILLLCSACSMNSNTTIKSINSNEPISNSANYEIKNAKTLTFTLFETTPTSSLEGSPFVVTAEEIGTKNFEISTLMDENNFIISINVNGVSKVVHEFTTQLNHSPNIECYSTYSNQAEIEYPNETHGDIILLAQSYSPTEKNEAVRTLYYAQPFTSEDLILDNPSINDFAYIQISFK
ncbi:hypothetical protein [Anaerorhabdus sp.]|uniref:hypothetical protein n=1 Tax=Anaerorhabdus sp. TaxID=1872524 RepID=UPI002B2015BA|nr:hypothetical protein [Anaerorhabdus sp.]MEA4874806.1 hypothetical protein [Anaerorhabdus sp.]